MKKLLLIVLLGVLLIGIISASDNKTKIYDKPTEKISVLDANHILEAQYQLITNECDKQFRFCNATIQTTFYKDATLYDSINFFKVSGNNLFNGKVRSYDIYYYTKGEKIDVNDYAIVCDKDKKTDIILNCSNQLTGTHKEDAPEWTLYTNQTFKDKDIKIWLIKAEKRPSWRIDWILNVLGGISLTDWAVWGNISTGDDAEVILNSPANNSVNTAGVVLFNASANVTNGANITNMSLWTNQSGTWNRVNISNYSITPYLIYSDATETAYGKNTRRSYNNPDAFINYVTIQSRGISGGGSYHIKFNYQGGSSYVTASQGVLYLSWSTQTFNNPNTSLIVTSIDAVEDSGLADIAVKDFNAYGYIYPNNWTTTFNHVITNYSVWNVEACDTDGVCGFAVSNWTIKYDLINITVISPLATVSSDNIIINATFNASGTMANCSYNITKGVNTEQPTTFINCSAFNDTHTLTLNTGLYVINFFGNTTTGIMRILSQNFTYSTTPISPGGGGGGGTLIEKLEAKASDFCLAKKTEETFNTAWKNFMNALTWSNFKLMWFALWNNSFCVGSASLVPLTG